MNKNTCIKVKFLNADSPLPFPDSGMLLRGSVNLCDTKSDFRTHEGVSGAVFSVF